MENKNSLFFLDGIRGLAALYVMIGHARWVLWEGYSEGFLLHPEMYSWYNKILVYFFSFFKYGHEAVLLFFVLSGFVIHYRYSKQLVAKVNLPFDWGAYFFRRIKRIYPPLIFAIFLTYIFDSWGIFLKLPIYFGHTMYESLNQNIVTDHTFTTIGGNVCFLMRIHVPVFGTNGPLWSLAYEGWFYIFYPFFFIVTKRSIVASSLLLTVFFVLSIFGLFPFMLLNVVFGLMLCWWLGALLADVYTKNINFQFKYLSFLSILFIPIIFLNLKFNNVIDSLLWSLSFVGLFSLCFYLQERNITLRFLNSLKWLGSCSYSLYILHFPILVFFSGLILKYQGKLPTHFIFVFIGIAVSIISAYFFSMFIEKPFISKKKND